MIPYMVGKLAPNPSHLTRGLVKYVPGRGYFRAVSSQSGDKFVTSPPPPPIVERVMILLKIIARRLRKYCERVGILPEKQSAFRPKDSTTNMMFVILRLQELTRKNRIPLYVCFIDLTKAYDSEGL